MDDLARLGVAGRVVRCRLQITENLQRGDRELRPEQQCLEARDDGVPAEDGHEPRHPGRRQLADPVLAAVHPERRQVGHGAAERVSELVPGRPQLRNAQLPGGERLADPRELVAEPPLGHARDDLRPVEERDDVQPEIPALARLQLQAVDDASAVDLALPRQDHLRPRGHTRLVLEQELVVGLVVLQLDGRRQRLGVLRVSEREVEVLDGEDVREVARDLDPQLQRHRPHPLVLDDHAILHRLADEALADDRDLVRIEILRARVAEVERGGEVVHLVRGQQQRALAVDRELQAGQEAGVLGEEPACRPGADVSDVVADAEGRALEDRDRHAYGSELLLTILEGELCARALTTSSSTLT